MMSFLFKRKDVKKEPVKASFESLIVTLVKCVQACLKEAPNHWTDYLAAYDKAFESLAGAHYARLEPSYIEAQAHIAFEGYSTDVTPTHAELIAYYDACLREQIEAIMLVPESSLAIYQQSIQPECSAVKTRSISYPGSIRNQRAMVFANFSLAVNQVKIGRSSYPSSIQESRARGARVRSSSLHETSEDSEQSDSGLETSFDF